MNNTVHQTLTTLSPATLDAGTVFSGKASGHKVRGYATPCAYTPAIDSDYIFPETSRDIIVWLCSPPEPLYVYGPLGCGNWLPGSTPPCSRLPGMGAWNLPTLWDT